MKHDGSRPQDVAALVSGLEALGHLVQVDVASAWYRGSSGLDDVTVLVATGTTSWVCPQPGARNVVCVGRCGS